MPLDNEQDNEMSSVTSLIDKMCPEELEKLFAEADEHGVRSRLREAWSYDRRSDEASNFKGNQATNSEFHCYFFCYLHLYFSDRS